MALKEIAKLSTFTANIVLVVLILNDYCYLHTKFILVLVIPGKWEHWGVRFISKLFTSNSYDPNSARARKKYL